MKKTIIAGLLLLAAIVGGAFLRTNSSSDDKIPNYSAGDYEADTWYETVEYDDYTVIKHRTMGAASVIVEFSKGDSPVSVTIANGSKTTLIYEPDYLSYDMYISYRNDTYTIEDDFSNLDTIVSYAFDWSEDTFLGSYSEEETMYTDEEGNIIYKDEEGNEKVYQYADEIE